MEHFRKHLNYIYIYIYTYRGIGAVEHGSKFETFYPLSYRKKRLSKMIAASNLALQ